MSQKDKVCLELVFSKTLSDTESRKIKEFWKFIDSQSEVQPYKIEKDSESRKSSEKEDDESDCNSRVEKNIENLVDLSNRASENNARFWYDELRLFQTLGLDKIALATCKRTDLEASRKENATLILSDMVDQPYEEVETDLKDFEKRLKNKTRI